MKISEKIMSNTSQYIIGLKQTKCGVETVKFREKLWTDEETKSLIATYKQCKQKK